MWEKELKLIDILGKLYPDFNIIKYTCYKNVNVSKPFWVYMLCKHKLDQRIPNLEKFIKENCAWVWYYYRDYFKITDEQCGKKS